MLQFYLSIPSKDKYYLKIRTKMPNSTPNAVDSQTTPTATDTKEVNWEERYKNLQKVYTKTTQDKVAAEAALSALQRKVQSMPPVIDVTEAEKQELDNLKFSDPDTWFKRMKEIEDKSSKKLAQETEEEKRAKLFDIAIEGFNETSDIKLTKEMIENDIPRRLTKQLEDGSLELEEFLVLAAKWIETPKVVASTNTVSKQPNLSKVAGASDANDITTDSNKSFGDVYEGLL